MIFALKRKILNYYGNRRWKPSSKKIGNMDPGKRDLKENCNNLFILKRMEDKYT